MFRRAEILIVCLLLWSSAAARAQGTGNNLWFVRGGATPGFILPTNPFAIQRNGATDPVHLAPNVTIEVGRRTDGSSEWHEVYGTPSYGFGFSSVRIRNGASSSRPVEAYTFFSWPFVRLSDRVQLTTDFGMGLSWRWREMVEKTNAYENVLGSNLNARLNWGFYVRYLSTPKLVLYGGADFTHRSNGGMVQPDVGINVIGPKVALQYNLGTEAPTLPTTEPLSFAPAWEFIVGGSGGLKSVVEQRNPMVYANVGTFDVTAAAQRHFYEFGKFAGGADVFSGSHSGLGVYGGYEHVIARFSALFQIGDNVVRARDDSGLRRLYSRYGWRYQISQHIWSTFAIRAHGFRKASALEIGVGYRFRRTTD
jgi:hypothetical protein